MPGGGGRESLVVRDLVQRFRLVAFLCGVISRGGRGRGREQPALPRSAGRGRCPGDMMIDWVSPACGDAAAQSNQAVRLALRARPAAADSGSAGAGRGGPHRVSAAAAWPGRAGGSRAGHHGGEGVSGGGERVVAELGQDVAGLPEDLAGLGQRGALAVAAVLDLGVVARGPGPRTGRGSCRPRRPPSAAPAVPAGTAARAGPCGRRSRR